MTEPDATEYVESPGGYKVFTAMWKPEKEPKGLIHIVHGYGEHLMHYDDVAKRLIDEGFLVYANDHYGHGCTDGDKGDIIDFNDLARDLLFLIKRESADNPRLPVFVLAHSMGGLIALRATLENPNFCRGIVMISPAIIISPETASPLRIFVGKWLASWCPHLIVVTLQPSKVTRNETYLKKHENDPLDFNFIRAKFGIQALNAQIDLENRLGEIKIPYLIEHGNADMVTDISGSRLLIEKTSSEDKTLVEVPDAYHQLHHELDDVTDETFRVLFKWIEERL